jgi:hypothetical protein
MMNQTMKQTPKRWEPRCLITETGIIYPMDQVTPNDIVDDVSCAQIFGSAPKDLPDRIELFRRHRRATFAADRCIQRHLDLSRA